MGGGVSGGKRTEWNSTAGNAEGWADPGAGVLIGVTATVSEGAAHPVINRQCAGGWVGAAS